MSSTPSIATAASTITNPMSAVFTPPSSCSSHWTYEAQSANSISGGLLLQDAQFDRPDTSCFPTGFGGWGRAPSFIQIFSPGACPIGYTTANNNFNTEATTAICCPSDFLYTSYLSSVNGGGKTAEYFGCTSMFGKAGKTTVFAEAGGFSSTSDGTATMFTAVSGPITMWAQPITIAFQEADLSLFTTSSSSTVPSTSTSTMSSVSSTATSISTSSISTSSTSASSTTTSSTTASSTTASSTTSQAAIASLSPSSTSPTTTQSPNQNLSIGAIAGIAISAAAILAITIGAAIYFRKTRKPTPSAGRDIQMGHPGPDQSYWQHGGNTDKPRPYYPHHEPYYNFQCQKQPEELDGRQRIKIAELPYTGDRRYELD